MGTRVSKLITLILLLFAPTFAMEQSEIDSQKEQAYVYYNTNQGAKAFAVLEQIPENSRDSDILLIMGNIVEDYKKPEQARAFMLQALVKNSENYKAYYNLGCLYLKEEKYFFAIDYFKKAIKYNKNFAFAYYNIGCAYLGLKDYKKARKYFLKAIAKKPDEKDFFINLAYCYKQLGQEKSAKRILEGIPN